MSRQIPQRVIPRPLPNHPGNVFLEGEEVSVPVGEGDTAWRALDYEGKVVAEGKAAGGHAGLGRLPVGYYEVRRGDEANGITVGVLAPLRAATPLTSPIAIDVAMAWFYKEPEMAAVANLCTLAGINRVRDRLSWGEMQPERGPFAPPNRYDATARAQSAAGLQVLQVNHSSPQWANPDSRRFPLDLRDAYNFYKAMAARWKGEVVAFEPWNESDISVFGGHTGAEIASLQKAGYLGLKAGNPGVIACQNVFAVAQHEILSDFGRNAAWPYFDTFNLHHYAAVEAYPQIYAEFRAVSAGRPLWVTECNVPVQWTGDPKAQEPSEKDLRTQADRVARIYASSIYEGAAATYYFMLPHYVEGQTQFGVLHKDLTPRPAFLAVAAAGRLLADAKPLGRLKSPDDNVRAFVFRARPDGQEREVLVAWTRDGQTTLDTPVAPVAAYDQLGRPRAVAGAAQQLTAAPLFAVFPRGAFTANRLEAPPAPAPLLGGKPSPVVLQAIWPQDRVALGRSAYRISSEKIETIPVYAYNFDSRPARGRLRVTAPAGWTVQAPDQVDLAPGERKELRLSVDCRNGAGALSETVELHGDFGAAGSAVLSLRLMPEPLKLREGAALPLPGAADPARWQALASAGSDLKLGAADGALQVACKLGGGDRWIYPIYALHPDERAVPGYGALRFTLSVQEGAGTFRAIFDEDNGSSYVADLTRQPKAGETIEAIALLSDANYGAGWSKPDPNGHLDPEQIKSFKIGCNATTGSVRYSVKDVRWVKF